MLPGFRQYILIERSSTLELMETEHENQTRASRERQAGCSCRSVLAAALKFQAIERARVQAILAKGGHPYEHTTSN